MSNRSFEKLLLEAVDEGLSSLGDSAKKAVYFYLEKTFKISRQDIPNRVEEFTDAIEKFFGVGAITLEILIMKHLYEKVGGVVKYDQGQQKDLVFAEYITAARQTFLKKKTRAF